MSGNNGDNGVSPGASGQQPALSVTDVAKEMSCSLTHVLNLIHGKVHNVPTLPAVKTGRLYRIRRVTFNRWIEQCESEQID